MAELLDQGATYEHINYIVKRARKFIVIISPFVDYDNLFDLVSSRHSPDVFVQIFAYRNSGGDEDVIIEKLSKLQNVLLFALDKARFELDRRFHCKCYFNESRFLISSMNLSWVKNKRPNNNLEFRVLLYKLKDKSLYFNAINWFCTSFTKKIFGSNQSIDSLFNHVELGHCTCCGVSIERNIKIHYCSECYYTHIKYCNVRILDYCHYCGGRMNNVEAVMHRDCYEKFKRIGSD